ncbi:MAG: DUF2231 domain-containing protein [Pseudomonadota bacterium]|nr:DUF2231 domain-containing protein [Pseudomonadota bacterium]
MYGRNPHSTAQIGGHPIHPMLIPFPIACLVGAFVTDLIYLNTGDRGFATASHWLIGFGIGTGLLAAVFGMIDYMGDDRIRRMGTAIQHMIANVSVIVISIINFAVRLGDPGDVASLGVYLSGVVVLILLYSGWLGGELVYRHRVAVQETPDKFSGYEDKGASERSPSERSSGEGGSGERGA